MKLHSLFVIKVCMKESKEWKECLDKGSRSPDCHSTKEKGIVIWVLATIQPKPFRTPTF